MTPLVLTSLGRIRGRKSRTRNHRTLYSFRAIPYAKPPVQELRFSLPQPAEPWSGTLDCSSKESKQCLQVNVLAPESKLWLGSEDCLYLNVFTPNLPGAGNNVQYPVIVFLHGGAFCVGSNDSNLYGPDILLDRDVVLVTVNYRLGPFGFFSLNCDEAPGNQGCHDQNLALKWVQEHISVFGGDKNNVTLFGESSGGMSTLMHLVSPLSQGLFHKLISMSGPATSPFLHNDRDSSIYARKFAEELGANPDDSAENLLKHLRKLPAKNIIEKATIFKDWDVTSPMPWKPICDHFASKPFFPKPFSEMVKTFNFSRNMPMLIGSTAEEGLILSAPFHKSSKKWDVLFKNWEAFGPQILFNRETDLITEEDKISVNKIRENYFDNLNFPSFTEANLKLLEEMFSTFVFHAPLDHDINLLHQNGCQQIYHYLFNFQGTMTMADLFRLSPIKLILNFSGRHMGFKLYQKRLGTCHGDELFYLFPFASTGFPATIKTAEDEIVSKNWVEVIASFVTDAKPGSSLGIDWECYDPKEKNKVIIGTSLTSSPSPETTKIDEKIRFWKELVQHGNETPPPHFKPIPKLHQSIAERRNLVIDPAQLFS